MPEPDQGTWDPYIRDIDPSMIISNTAGNSEESSGKKWWINDNPFNWDCPNEEWVDNSDELPNFQSFIQSKNDHNEEWLILEGYPEWAEPKKIGVKRWDYPHKRIWCHIRSYLVKKEDYNSLKNWSLKQNFMGRWMPESSDRYEIFSREYYRSSAHKYFMSEYYEGTEWKEIHEREANELIAPVMVPTESFLWEEEFDKSKDETISFLKPCNNIYEGMKLNYSRKEGEFLDENNEMVCFAANIYHHSKPFLLIKKEPFLKYLENNKLEIIWTVLGEKQIIGGGASVTSDTGMLEISGAYYLENNEIQGRLNLQKK